MTAGNHLNEHYAQRPDIATLIDGFAEDLLGSHVGERPGGRDALRSAGRGNNPSEAKVNDLGNIILGDDNIRRLDVTMHDVARMSRAQPFCDLDGQVE